MIITMQIIFIISALILGLFDLKDAKADQSQLIKNIIINQTYNILFTPLI